MALARLFAYIVLFVVRCRFPSSKSVADIIRQRYDDATLSKVRRLEKLDFKLRKCKLDMEFLEICSENNLMPKFLNFKVTNTSLRDSKAYRDCQLKLLKQEIQSKKSQHRTKEKELKTLQNELVRTLSLVDYSHIISLFLKSNDDTLSKCKEIHKKKLYKLGYFERDKDVNDPDQVIHKFSSYTLNDTEKSLLAKGLNFALPPRKLNFADYMAPFEFLYKDVKDCDVSRHKLDILKVDMKKAAFSSFKRYNFLKELNLSLPEYQALKKLKANKDIVIHKSDKGNSVVIVDREDYLKRLSDMVNDGSKFEKLNVGEHKDYNFMVKEKKTVDSLLSELVNKKSIDENLRAKLSPDGPKPARLYGLPKIHKPLVDGLPKYRPIISQIGSTTYALAKYLLPFIEPLTTNEYTVRDTFHFVSMLDTKNHRLIMASLDVDSLFTNIPLRETIELVTAKVYGNKRKVNGILKSDFKRLLTLSTKGSVFYFNGVYYRQRDGVAMGSPLGPALANAFLCHHEGRWLEECPLSYSPVFYARYVDDIFVLLRSNDHVARLATYLSSKHRNINFTFELERDGVLPFLDVNVYRDSECFTTTVHRKDTFSGVLTNFKAFIPDTYKKGLISTLLFRAYSINSSYSSLHEEVEKLKKVFSRNAYPNSFVDKCIFRFFNKIHEKKLPVQTVPKKEVVMILPFLGTTSWSVKKDLNRVFQNILPFCKLKLVFKISNRVSTYFSFKDKLPVTLDSGVIYKYTCASCKVSYVGCTKRYWETRLEDHTHISALTGGQLSGRQIFAPHQHVRTAKCSPSGRVHRDDFEIIGRDSNSYLLQVKESIFIYKHKPELNGNQQSVPLYLFT